MTNKQKTTDCDPVIFAHILHQTILDRTHGGIRALKVTHGVKEISVSGMARDFYHFQLAISAATDLRLKNLLPIRFDIQVD